MPDAADDRIDWDNFRKAWLMLGLEPDAFPAARVERVGDFSDPPEPEPPQLEAPSLSDDEWEVLAPLMPSKNKYLSKLEPRAFLDAALFWVWCGQKFMLVPTPSVERFRAKLYRSFNSGLFAALALNSARYHQVSDENRALLDALAEAERVYVKRREDFKVARLKKLARERVASKTRAI